MTRRLALLSVSDKTGIELIARQLISAGYTLISTGGTAKRLKAEGVAVEKVSDITGYPEIMNGRVKTLHPVIHGGILGMRDEHGPEAAQHNIDWIDVVVVNLYPFESTVSQPNVSIRQAVEQIDIGGPTMVRAAAKNHQDVTIVTSPSDYESVGAEIASGGTSMQTRQRLAVKAFEHTAAYDGLISQWMGEQFSVQDGHEGSIPIRRVQALRYGENPHQSATFYASPGQNGRSLARIHQHQGKALSFNNLADLDGCLRAVYEFTDPACVVVKHMNPCGAAVSLEGATRAFQLALSADPISAYGGIIAFNRRVDSDTVKAIRTSRTFFEVIAAPGYTDDARALLAPREKLRVLELPEDWANTTPGGKDARRVQGGWLFQDWDVDVEPEWNVVSDTAPTPDQTDALQFAWRVCRSVKSNAIVLARAVEGGFVLNGVGAGQMSRVDSVRLAISKATASVEGSVLASDAFFPFPDGVQIAIEAGVKAFVQPGGSIRDDAVLDTVNTIKGCMVFTGTRHFRH